MQRQYETKLTEMAQEREAARPTNHAKALQEATNTEETNDKQHSDGIEKLRQEVGRMAQEKNDLQRQLEEVLREAARDTSDKAPPTATVRATGDTCRRTHG